MMGYTSHKNLDSLPLLLITILSLILLSYIWLTLAKSPTTFTVDKTMFDTSPLLSAVTMEFKDKYIHVTIETRVDTTCEDLLRTFSMDAFNIATHNYVASCIHDTSRRLVIEYKKHDKRR